MPIVLLDSTPLGLLVHPANDGEAQNCKNWVKSLVSSGIVVAIPEIIDYEIRRELLRAKLTKSVKELDLARQIFPLAPLKSEMLMKAADLWAKARNAGQATASNKNIDIDVLLAAQAIILTEQEQDCVVVATSNLKHLERYTPLAFDWHQIEPQLLLNSKMVFTIKLKEN